MNVMGGSHTRFRACIHYTMQSISGRPYSGKDIKPKKTPYTHTTHTVGTTHEMVISVSLVQFTPRVVA
eukprot:UN03796